MFWGSSSGSLYVTNSCTHARTYHWPRQKYTCMHRWWRTTGGWGGKRAGQKCAINWTLGTQKTLLLQAKQESKLKQGKHRINVGCSEKRLDRWRGKDTGGVLGKQPQKRFFFIGNSDRGPVTPVTYWGWGNMPQHYLHILCSLPK